MIQLKEVPEADIKKYYGVYLKACLSQLRNRDKAERLGVRCDRIVPYLYDRLMKADNCEYCGRRFKSFERMTIDHVIPLSRGGGHVVGNIAICCERCNHDKADKTKPEFTGELQRWEQIKAVMA